MKKYKIMYKNELVDIIPAESSDQAISIIENMLQISIKGLNTYFYAEEMKQNIFQRVSNEIKYIKNIKKFFIKPEKDKEMGKKIRTRNIEDKYIQELSYAVKNGSLELEKAEEILGEGLDSIKRWSENHPY
uniref:Uncharacterized protein n=1 Tax=viral metagenome TaxID=1070528 RepID=A0A6M3LGT2_9ZZZZ